MLHLHLAKYRLTTIWHLGIATLLHLTITRTRLYIHLTYLKLYSTISLLMEPNDDGFLFLTFAHSLSFSLSAGKIFFTLWQSCKDFPSFKLITEPWVILNRRSWKRQYSELSQLTQFFYEAKNIHLLCVFMVIYLTKQWSKHTVILRPISWSANHGRSQSLPIQETQT